MPKRRRHQEGARKKGYKLKGLTPQEARQRALKGWITKHKRYNYAKGSGGAGEAGNSRKAGKGSNKAEALWQEEMAKRRKQRENVVEERRRRNEPDPPTGQETPLRERLSRKDQREAGGPYQQEQMDFRSHTESFAEWRARKANTTARDRTDLEFDKLGDKTYGPAHSYSHMDVVTGLPHEGRDFPDLERTVSYRRASGGERDYVTNYGKGKSEVSANDLMKQKLASEQWDTLDGMMADPEFRQLATRMSPKEFADFKAAVVAGQFAKERSRVQNVDEMIRSSGETTLTGVVNSHLRASPGRRQATHYQAVVQDLKAHFGNDIKDHEAQDLAGAIIRYHAQAAGTDKEPEGRAAIGRLTTRLGNKAAQRAKQAHERSIASRFSNEMLDLRLREQQGAIKFGSFSTFSRDYLGPQRLDPSTPEGKHWRSMDFQTRKATIARDLDRIINQPTDLYGAVLDNPKNQLTSKVSQEGGSQFLDYQAQSKMVKNTASPSEDVYIPGSKPQRKADPKHGTRPGDITKEEINHVAGLLAASTAVPGSPEYSMLKERIDSLRIRTSFDWDPSMLHDEATQRIFTRHQKGQDSYKSPTQRYTGNAENFYKGVGHEQKKGLRGVQAQAQFIIGQQKNRFHKVKSGDYYMGWDAKGKAVSPDKARFGISPNKKWEYTTASGRKKDVEFGDTTTEIENAQSHKLTKKFDDTVNVKLGARKVSSDYDVMADRKVDKEIVLPVASLKTPQTKYVQREKVVTDPDTGNNRTVTSTTRIRLMPYDQTSTAKGDHDQIAIKIPGRGKIGERLIYANLDSENETISNVSRYALGPARANKERVLRMRQEQVARLAHSGEYGTSTPRRVGRPTENFEKVKLGKMDDVGGPTHFFITDQRDPAQLARASEILAREARAAGDHKEASLLESKAKTLRDHISIKDVGGAATAAAGYGFRRRITKVWAPAAVNKVAADLGDKSPRFQQFLNTNSYGINVIDVKQGLFQPVGASIANAKYMVSHPLSSPSGVAMGIDYGTPYYRERSIHTHRRLARQLKKQRNELQYLSNTEKFFTEAATPGASRYKRFMAKRLDPRKRDMRYSEFTDTNLRAAKLEHAMREALGASKQEQIHTMPINIKGKTVYEGGKATLRSRRAHQFLMNESDKLQETVAGLANEMPNTKPGFGGRYLPVLYNPAGGGGPKGHPISSSVMGGSWAANNKSVLVGGAVVATVVGSAYLYHRHKNKQARETGGQEMSFYNRMLPGPVSIPAPYARTVERRRIGSHAINDELKLTGRKIPTRFGVGIQDKTIWKGSPADRGYDPNAKLFGGMSMRVPKDGATSDKIFRDPNASNRKRLRTKGTHTATVGGRRVARINIDDQTAVKLKTKNPNALTTKDRENLVYSYGLLEDERLKSHSNYRAQEELRQMRSFYTSGVADQRLLRKLDDPEEVWKIRKKKNQKLKGLGELGTSRRAKRSQRLQDRFAQGAHPEVADLYTSSVTGW